MRDEHYLLPRQESPSSHILKFELADYRHLPAYETFTTRIAKAIGLPVVDIQLKSVGKTHYALIERYDRFWDNSGQVQRLHQEDFCPALGYGHERKYQEDGGPTFAQCYRLIQDISSDLNISVSKAVQYLKGKSSHKLLSEYSKLRKRYWGQHLWARGYWVATSGNVTDEVWKEYSKSQTPSELADRSGFSQCSIH